jgi:uncharacterized protein (DUF2062 family)
VLRRLLDRFRGLLQLDDPPWRIALALAVGVFISCTPTFGFQTILALLVAALFRLSKAATVTGVWVNLPWVTPLVYAGALKVGAAILPQRDGLGGLGLMLLVGTTVVGVVAAAVTYVIAFGALRWRRGKAARADGVTTGTGVTTAREPAPSDGPSGREPAA